MGSWAPALGSVLLLGLLSISPGLSGHRLDYSCEGARPRLLGLFCHLKNCTGKAWTVGNILASWGEDPVSSEITAHSYCFSSELTGEEETVESILQKGKLRPADPGQRVKGWFSSPYFSPDELEVKGMIRVAPGGGEKAIIEALGSLWRGFFNLRKLGGSWGSFSASIVGVDLLQVSECCFFKHQLVELPSSPQLPVSLVLIGKSHEVPVALGPGWCCFISAPTPSCPVHLRADPGCVCSAGFWIHLVLQGLWQIGFDAFSGNFIVAPDFCCLGDHGVLGEIICPQILTRVWAGQSTKAAQMC